MQIGDKVWIKDENHRIYFDPEGNKLNSPWYRGYFVEYHISGETNQSWIVGNHKVNKKTLTYKTEPGKDGILYTSEEQIEQISWIHQNQYKIADRVKFCNDIDKLKKIEEILNS